MSSIKYLLVMAVQIVDFEVSENTRNDNISFALEPGTNIKLIDRESLVNIADKKLDFISDSVNRDQYFTPLLIRAPCAKRPSIGNACRKY